MLSLRRTRLVRLHLINPRTGEPGETYEGFQRGRRTVAGHYVLIGPKRLQPNDAGDEVQKVSLQGQLEVPTAVVLHRQVLG